MVAAKGNLATFAMVKQSAYETAVLCAAGHGIVLGPGGEGLSSMAELLPDDTLEGRHQELEGERGNETHGGDLTDVRVIFDTVHRPLAFALGTAGVPERVITIEVGAAGNDRIDFTEGVGGAKVAQLVAGVYSRAELAAHVTTQMNAVAADNTYLCSFDGGTNKFTIARASGSATIALNWNTGPNAARSAGTTLGYLVAADDSGGTSYLADNTVLPGAYRHVLKPAAEIEDLFATLVVGFPGIGVKEYVGTKFNGFTMNMPNGQRWGLTFPIVAHKAVFDDSGPNKISTLSGITRPGTRRSALFRQTILRMNAQSGAALAAGDNQKASVFNAQLANNLATDEFTLEYGDKITNPVRDDKIKLTGSIEYPRLGANLNDLITALARTPQKMASLVTAGLIAGETRTHYAFNCYYPSIQFSAESSVSGPGRVPKTLNYEAQAVESLPTGFPTGYLDAITIEVVNTTATDPLA
jgi:hypothetical protein